MYHNIKSGIVINNEASDLFCCGKGPRQGEKLSPILFSLFLNDVENYMFTNNGFNLELNDDYMDVYLKLIVLLYADDTVIFSKSEDQLVSVVILLRIIVPCGN